MIRHLSHNEIDKVRWDSAIDGSFNGMVYAMSWYLDVVSPGWEALVEEEYRSVFPLTQRQKSGIHYLHQPFFTQQLGLFSADQNTTDEKLNLFLSHIPSRYKLIEIQLNHFNCFNSSEFGIRNRLTHHLNLHQPYQKIREGYSDNLKRNIKRAKENNLNISSEFSTDELIELFRANRGRDVETLKSRDYETLKKLIAEASKRNLIYKSAVITEGRLQAGAVFLKSCDEHNRRKGKHIFLFSAVNDNARESGAMSAIIDDFIQNHAEENMNLDFEGSMDQGLARFYKSFGSVEIVYLQIRKNKLPWWLRWLKE